MGLVTTHGGLLVPEGALEAAVAAALKHHDPDLRLVPQDSDHYGRRIYKVYRWAGSDRPAEFVCGWWDDQGRPIPLSMALLDRVQLLDRNTRGREIDEDEHNRRLKEERYKDYLRDAEELVKEFSGRLEGKRSSPLPRSRSLYAARNRVRARTKDQELRP